jgi:signal transduction histidine kinase
VRVEWIDLYWVPVSTTRTDHPTAEPGLAERYQLVRRIADDLAHELKNPLNAMVINLEVLRARVRAGDPEAALERIDVLDQETHRLHNLLDHVLRLLRPDPPGPAEFRLDTVLAEVGTIAAVLGKLARRGFDVRPEGGDAVVLGRREPLRFALLALAEAAIAGAPSEDDRVLLAAEGSPAAVELTLTAPAGTADRLRQDPDRERRCQTAPHWVPR